MSTILTLKQIEDFFQELTCKIIGLNTELPENQSKVRVDWQPSGAPAWKRNEDIIFLRVNEVDEQITNLRDVIYSEKDINTADKIVCYTRVHEISWILYGPNSFDDAEKVKNGLFEASYKEQCERNNLFLVPSLSPPIRTPEPFNNQWWSRSDFSARFNEKVILDGSTPYIKSAIVDAIMKG